MASDLDAAPRSGPVPRVLVVEDDFLLRLDLAETLRGRGWEVVEAGTADDAMAVLARDARFTLLLTDVHMPGRLTGLDLARETRQMHPHIKIAVMSGQHLPSAEELQRVDLFLSKPFVSILSAIEPLVKGQHD